MMMKKCFAALLASVVRTALWAGAAQAAITVEGDAYAGFYDKYLWRGFDLSGGTPVVQGGVDMSANGFTLSYWSNLQTSDDVVLGSPVDSGEITETDITLDYSFDVNEMVSVSVGNIFYRLEGADTNELYAGVSLNTILAPSLTVYWDYDEATEDGYFVAASVSHTLPVNDQLGVNLGAAVTYNGASDYAIGNYHGWHNYELGISADYAFAEHFTVTPSFLYSDPLGDDAEDAIEDEILAGVSVAFNF